MLNRLRYRKKPKRKPMTYILGAKCSDGVVLVADRKYINPITGEVKWIDKLFMDASPVVVGSSGVSGLFSKFRDRAKSFLISNPIGTVDTYMTHFEIIVHDLNRDYHDRLENEKFDVIMGMQTSDAGAVFKHILPFGFTEPTFGVKGLGSGEPHGTFFLKTLYHDRLTMEQVAEIGYFIIRYIEDNDLDNSVGIGKHKPLVWFIPQNITQRPYIASEEFLTKVEEKTDGRLSEFLGNIHALFTEFSS